MTGPTTERYCCWRLKATRKAACGRFRWTERRRRSRCVTKFNERNARFSPDGRWVAYSSNESGIDEVYVQPCPSLAGKWQISTRGGDQAVWSRHGRMLYYRGGG